MNKGRPTKYNKIIADLICERVATNPIGLNKICAMYADIPEKTTVNQWRYKYPDFREKYAQAKIIQSDLLAEECLEIADDNSDDIKINPDGFETVNAEFVARSRLRIDTRKWLASKLMPKQYGQRSEETKTLSDTLVEKLIDKLIE